MTRDETLGKYIRRLREDQHLSLLELSTRTRVAYAHLSRIENESTMPSPETIVKICDVIGGDLTLMLQKANNLPRVILDRLIERDQAVVQQTLRRSFPGEPEGDQGAGAPGDDSDSMAVHEAGELRKAMEELVALRPHARRAVIQLISVLYDEGDGDPG